MRTIIPIAVLIAACTLVAACDDPEHEICDRAGDEDHDGAADCADPVCAAASACAPCGNGTIDVDETCDDGNQVAGDGCTERCQRERCGDAIRQPDEACDDGNVVDGDGCDHDCSYSRCGNGVPTSGEACDDGNLVDDDGCDHNCQLTACGNGVAGPSEGCDDGNLVAGDGCDELCRIEACGNAALQTGEECDDGNGDPGDGCDGCVLEQCGNGVLQVGEDCEDGNVVNGDGCDATCRYSTCGNGVVAPGEECDDGNAIDGDACDRDCRMRCGDGEVESLVIGPRAAYSTSGVVLNPLLGDVDGDGDLDVVMTPSLVQPYFELRRNVGGGRLGPPELSPGHSAFSGALHDLDDDGDLDIAVACANGPPELYRNDGLGHFSLWQTLAAQKARSVTVGDIDGDSDLDLVFVGTALEILRQTAPGTWVVAQSLGGRDDARLGDVDEDGDPDLLHGGSSSSLVLRRNTGGVFGAPVTVGASADQLIAIGDLDGDDHLDASARTGWFEGNGTGGFTRHAFVFTGLEADARSIKWIDLDRDGWLDLVFRYNLGSFGVRRNLGSATFGPTVLVHPGFDVNTVTPHAATAGDLDGDGRPEIVIVLGDGSSLTVIPVLGHETCDDANHQAADGCSPTCQLEGCGDGIVTVSLGEECDDTNTVEGDGCDSNCRFTACGNGLVSPGEACDDGNVDAGDGCSPTCVIERCGDGVAQPGIGEACDDSNAIEGDGCDSNCTVSACGNGIVAPNESCEPSSLQPAIDGCSDTCAWACEAATADNLATGAADHCYAHFATPATWDAAKVACESLGASQGRTGHLATIGSAAEDAIVGGLVAGNTEWIGMNDIAVEAGANANLFVWITGEPVAYHNFLTGQPNNSGNQDCVGVDFSTKWADWACTDLRPYVCELAPP